MLTATFVGLYISINSPADGVKVISDNNNKPVIQVEYLNKTHIFHPEEISSMILRYLKVEHILLN